MRTYTRLEFTNEVTSQALRHAADHGVCVSCRFSRLDSSSFGVAIVDSQGWVVSPNSAISIAFSLGSTGKVLVSANGSRRAQLNEQSLITAKIEVRRLFERVCK